LIADIPDTEKDKRAAYSSGERFVEWFQPAIANGLLRMEQYTYSDSDYTTIKEKSQLIT